jgi:hypothetical protein
MLTESIQILPPNRDATSSIACACLILDNSLTADDRPHILFPAFRNILPVSLFETDARRTGEYAEEADIAA